MMILVYKIPNFYTIHRTTNPTNDMCAQWRLRSAWTPAHSDQSLCSPHEKSLGPKLPIQPTAKTLISLRCVLKDKMLKCCVDPANLSLRCAHMSFCWFCHAAAHMNFFNSLGLPLVLLLQSMRPLLESSTQSAQYRYVTSTTVNILKFRTPGKQREVTNFAKGGNLIASLAKLVTFLRIFGIFLVEINILLQKFLEH